MRYDVESIKKRKQNEKVAKKIVEIVAIIILYNILLIAISYANNIDIFNIFGYKSYIIKTSSMEPTIKKGDVVVNKKVQEEEIKEGDVITFLQEKEVITHRITRIDNNSEGTKYTTKGDNNNIEDTLQISYQNIEGKTILTIPYLGNIIQILENNLVFLIVILTLLIYAFIKIKNKEKQEYRREKKKIEEDKKQKK